MVDIFGFDKSRGALVSLVESGSSVDKVGIEVGDVIFKFNGKEIVCFSELFLLVVSLVLGEKVSVELWCKGKLCDIMFVVGDM